MGEIRDHQDTENNVETESSALFAGDLRTVLLGRLRRSAARVLLYKARAQNNLEIRRRQHKLKLELIAWIVATGVAYLTAHLTGDAIEVFFSDNKRLDALGTVVVTIGGALIGGAAIAASFILFAMQVNVERLPYGLFKKLSSDSLLLTAVGATFSAAIIISFLSVAITSRNAAAITLATILGTAVVLRLFFYSYARSLDLINPGKQISIVVGDVRRSLRMWERHLRWAVTAIDEKVLPNQARYDARRLAFQQMNPAWTGELIRGIRHVIALTRRAADQADINSSGLAFSALIRMNELYVTAKGKTFFSNSPMIENPLVTDAVITETLDQLRLIFRGALARQDEEQMGQILQTYRSLSLVYLTIDYPDNHALKTHAHLAAAYLEGELDAIAPHNMVDAMMNGVRELGKVALAFVQYARPEEAVSMAQKIGLIGTSGTVREDHRPITLVSMQQLALLTYELIRTQEHDIGYASKSISGAANFTAKLFLEVPDSPLRSIHSSFLGPYFSYMDSSALCSRLGGLADDVAAAPVDSENAKRVSRNFAVWADGLNISLKDLLLLAVEKRSSFLINILHWITDVTEILLSLASAKASSSYSSSLREHARRIAMVLSWLPRDRDNVAFLETYDVTETYFMIAADAEQQGADALAGDMRRLLLRWGLEAGAEQTGWPILERSIYGLAVLGLSADTPDEVKKELSEALKNEVVPPPEICERVAHEIRMKAETLRQYTPKSRMIEQAMGAMNHEHLSIFLNDLADILSPDPKDEPSRQPG